MSEHIENQTRKAHRAIRILVTLGALTGLFAALSGCAGLDPHYYTRDVVKSLMAGHDVYRPRTPAEIREYEVKQILATPTPVSAAEKECHAGGGVWDVMYGGTGAICYHPNRALNELRGSERHNNMAVPDGGENFAKGQAPPKPIPNGEKDGGPIKIPRGKGGKTALANRR